MKFTKEELKQFVDTSHKVLEFGNKVLQLNSFKYQINRAKQEKDLEYRVTRLNELAKRINSKDSLKGGYFDAITEITDGNIVVFDNRDYEDSIDVSFENMLDETYIDVYKEMLFSDISDTIFATNLAIREEKDKAEKKAEQDELKELARLQEKYPDFKQ